MKIILVLLFNFGILCAIGAQAIYRPEIEASLSSIAKNTIAVNPLIRLNALGINRREANLQRNLGDFDTHVTSDLSYFLNRNNLIDSNPYNQFYNHISNKSGQFGIGLNKRFQNSLGIDVGIGWSRTSNSTPFDEFEQAQSPFLANNNGNISVQLSQPLLRGYGEDIAMANIRSSEKFLEAEKISLLHSSTEELLIVLNHYWQYLGAFETLKVYLENENRVQRLLEMTNALIEADKKPKAEIIQVKADLAEKEGLTILAHQYLFQTKKQLQRVIGLEEDEVLGDPVDDFPTPAASGFTELINTAQLQSTGIANRNDLKAIVFVQDAMREQLLLSQNALKPELNLDGVIEYGGFAKGNSYGKLVSLFGLEEGRKWTAGLSLNYVFPLQNNKAKSEVLLQNIEIQEQSIIMDNEQRKIKINIHIAVNNIRQSHAALVKSKEAYELYQLAFENEQEKFQNGLTTLINVILFQERLTSAELQYIQSKQQFASDLSQLRFETGTLITANDLKQDQEINTEQFYKIPDQE